MFFTNIAIVKESVLFVKEDIFPRKSLFSSPWHRMGTLFEEWLCINWAKVEQQRLTWHREHQKVLRGDLYQGLQDAVSSGRHDPQPSIYYYSLDQ
jgi:hypothetical protein